MDRPLHPTRKRPKSPVWTKVAIIFGAVVMVGSGGVVVGPTLLARWAFAKVPVVNEIPDELLATDISGAINFLLLGTDAGSVATDSDHTGRNTDSMVLVHIPASHDQIYMMSLPRDLLVTIPPNPDTGLTAPWSTKLNAAFSVGTVPAGPGPSFWDRLQGMPPDLSPAGRTRGAIVTMRVISGLVPGGLRFNGWATVDFDGFNRVVEALGSVHLCIDENVWSIHRKADGSAYDYYWATKVDPVTHANQLRPTRSQRYFYQQGRCYDMQPWEALDYSRQRYDLWQYQPPADATRESIEQAIANDADGVVVGESDYDRQRHQQQLLRAIVRQVASTDTLTNLGTISRLQQAAGDLLVLDLGGNPIQDWAFTLRHLNGDSITMVEINGGTYCPTTGPGGLSYQCLNPESYQLLEAVRDDNVFSFLQAHPDWIATDSGPAAAAAATG